jgi:polyisoprenoid-binding protein YceI
MKKLKSIALALVVVLGVATASAQTKNINTTTSTIGWVGKKVTGEHSGSVIFRDGALVFKGKKIVGGKFTVKMTSLTATDLTGEYLDKLNGHLKSDDFFGTEKFPTASLVFVTVGTTADPSVFKITANLTIKGITKPITFDLKVSGNTATTAFKVDRTKYDIKYNSTSFFDSIGDKAIYDDFELTVSLKY